MAERRAIYEAIKKEKKTNRIQLINSSNEIYGACRHRTRFHRYINVTESNADEEQTSSENGFLEKSDNLISEKTKTGLVQYCQPVSGTEIEV